MNSCRLFLLGLLLLVVSHAGLNISSVFTQEVVIQPENITNTHINTSIQIVRNTSIQIVRTTNHNKHDTHNRFVIISCVGDSITEGFGVVNRSFNSYPSVLQVEAVTLLYIINLSHLFLSHCTHFICDNHLLSSYVMNYSR